MAFQEFDELLLECYLSVVFRLVGDVRGHGFARRTADAEGAVAGLPGESAPLRPGIVNPFGGVGLQVAQRFGNGDGRW
jgi:hypothetical protein